MRPAGGAAAPLLEGQATVVTDDPASARFHAGARVFHVKFGYGRIVAVEGNKLEVAFDKAGAKKVIDSFVEPVD
jgi:DNA helicase-2/ATP-dependent DNA helicase PcrA